MYASGTSTLTSVPPLLERAKLAFVLSLRSAFASTFTDPALRYDDDQSKSKIRIYTAHPLRLEYYPAIVISTGGGDASFTYLMDDFVEEAPKNERDQVVFAGRVVFTMAVTILTNSTLERERILDHLIIYVRHLFRDNLHAFGLEYTKDIRVGPETLTEVENKPVYEQVLEIPCYMEYEAAIDQGALDTIRRIDLSVVLPS
jgi:hypothetical protein